MPGKRDGKRAALDGRPIGNFDADYFVAGGKCEIHSFFGYRDCIAYLRRAGLAHRSGVIPGGFNAKRNLLPGQPGRRRRQ